MTVEINAPRKQIGPAVWLLALFLRSVPAEWSGDEPVWVAEGKVVSDAELAERLKASRAVIAKWRLRLRRIGILGWFVAPGRGYAFWLAGLNRVFAGGGDNLTSQETEKQSAPTPLTTIWSAVEERSIALTGKVIADLTPAEGVQLAKALAQRSEIPSETRME